jgi:hypothetical protein
MPPAQQPTCLARLASAPTSCLWILSSMLVALAVTCSFWACLRAPAPSNSPGASKADDTSCIAGINTSTYAALSQYSTSAHWLPMAHASATCMPTSKLPWSLGRPFVASKVKAEAGSKVR